MVQIGAYTKALRKDPTNETKTFDALAKGAEYTLKGANHATWYFKVVLPDVAKTGASGAQSVSTVVRPLAKAIELPYNIQDTYAALTNDDKDATITSKLSDATPHAVFVVFKLAFVGGHALMLANWLKPNAAISRLSSQFLRAARTTLPAVWASHWATVDDKKKVVIDAFSDMIIFFNVRFFANRALNSAVGHTIGVVGAGLTIWNATSGVKANWKVLTKDSPSSTTTTAT